MEDKQTICMVLAVLLRMTRQFEDLEYLKYDDHNETVLARFKNGGLRVIGVEGDSGYAMLKDIVNHIGG